MKNFTFNFESQHLCRYIFSPVAICIVIFISWFFWVATRTLSQTTDKPARKQPTPKKKNLLVMCGLRVLVAFSSHDESRIPQLIVFLQFIFYFLTLSRRSVFLELTRLADVSRGVNNSGLIYFPSVALEMFSQRTVNVKSCRFLVFIILVVFSVMLGLKLMGK